MTDLEKELQDGIAYFEQILHVLPGDRTALEFLCVAYLQLGDKEKFLARALALTDAILREKNAESAAGLIEKLKESEDPRAQAAILKLQALAAPKPDLRPERVEDSARSARPDVAAEAETALLRRLVSEGVLTESLIQNAFDILNQSATSPGEFLISALVILEKENLTGANDALVAVADAAKTPPIAIETFDFPLSYARQLPEALVRRRAVIPFAKLGDEWAVAVLNPLDDDLRGEVAELLGARCHFFLAQPNGVEKVIERIYKKSDEEAAAQ